MSGQFLYYQESGLVMTLNDQDPRALKQLYAMYSTALYGIINRITQNAEISKGVLRVCFIEVWNNSCMFNPDNGSLFIWLRI